MMVRASSIAVQECSEKQGQLACELLSVVCGVERRTSSLLWKGGG